ncbi:hypothetical protein DPMN_103051 [Dreissena polymorpha]|uniref:Uncharacterized protein n=1 Tax=Dreissena polymorpha TaxID=45954 RepID=A0A9D4K276_DREPO|nr:hypothetical protein DPMN_103051 [Dreissena polymorpha]
MEHHRMLGYVDLNLANRHEGGVVALASSLHRRVQSLGPANVDRDHRPVLAVKHCALMIMVIYRYLFSNNRESSG